MQQLLTFVLKRSNSGLPSRRKSERLIVMITAPIFRGRALHRGLAPSIQNIILAGFTSKANVAAARISLDRTQMQVEDNLVNLSPGMAGTVEVKTGSRTVLTHPLSPLLRYKQESLRER
jgi:hypothetical protein